MENKIVVINKAINCKMLPNVLLVPGTNLLTEGQFKAAKKYIDAHKDLEAEEETLKDGSPLDLNVKKATAIIEAMNDEDVLAEWLTLEKGDKNRAGVIGAIEAKMVEIDAALEKKDNK